MFANAQAVSGASGTATGSNVGATKEARRAEPRGEQGRRLDLVPLDRARERLRDDRHPHLELRHAPRRLHRQRRQPADDGRVRTTTAAAAPRARSAFTATAGTTYQIAVDGYNKATGNVTLHWSQAGRTGERHVRERAADLGLERQGDRLERRRDEGARRAQPRRQQRRRLDLVRVDSAGERDDHGRHARLELRHPARRLHRERRQPADHVASNDDCCGGRQSKVSLHRIGRNHVPDRRRRLQQGDRLGEPRLDDGARAARPTTCSPTRRSSRDRAARPPARTSAQRRSRASPTTRATPAAPRSGSAGPHPRAARPRSTRSRPSFDTLLGVYTGSAVNQLTTITSNDDCCGGTQSKVSFSAVAGTTYQIAVDGYNKATGNVVAPLEPGKPAGERHVRERAVPRRRERDRRRGTNVAATKEPGEPNHAGNAGGASIWFTWVAQSAGTATIDTSGSSFDTLLGVYTGSPVNSLTTVASNDNCCGGQTSQVSFARPQARRTRSPSTAPTARRAR